MARTRRSVENLIALLLSVGTSGLLFGALLVHINHAQRARGQSANSVAMVILPSEQEKGDLSAIEVTTEIKTSVNGENPDDSDSTVRYRAYHAQGSKESVDYFPVSMLTQRPVVLQDIDPELPESLRRLEPQSFYLTLFINEYGDVDEVKLASIAALPPFTLDELKRHFAVMRFMPGRLEGRAVRCALQIHVQLYP